MKKLILILTAVFALGAFVAACGSSDENSGNAVEISDAWARTTTPTQTSGAIYMSIEAKDGDSLVKAEVPSSIAGKAELHETTEEGDPTAMEDSMEDSADMSDGHGMEDSGADNMDEHGADDSDHGSSPMMGMRQVDEISIPAGETVALEPGGFHIMLLDLTGQIEEGDTIPVTLTFEKAGTVEVDATAKTE